MTPKLYLPVLIWLLLLPLTVFANEYYVSPQGSDSNPGTQSEPWQTLQYAVTKTNPGDIVFVEDGVYRGTVIMARSGSPGAYITLKAVNKWGAKIEVDGTGKADGIKAAANYLTIDGFEIYDTTTTFGHEGNGITVYNNHHVNILNNKIHDFGGSGIQAAHFDHVLVENNVVYNNAKYNPNQSSGISMFQARAVDNAPGYHVIVRNNRSYGNINLVLSGNPIGTTDGNGILIDDFQNKNDNSYGSFPHRTLVENNLSYDNGGKGVQVYQSDFVDVFNNTAYHNNHDQQNTGRWRAELSLIYSYNTVWRNNIGVANPGQGDILQWNRAILIAESNNTVWENNITYSGTPGDQSINLSNTPITEDDLANNQLGVNPLFTNASNLDFSLTQGSPAIDAGSDQIVSFIDINYQSRSQGSVDIGAFEFASSPVPVLINAFNAAVLDSDIQLSWSTAYETDNAGFDVEVQAPGGSFASVLFVNSQGDSESQQNYSATLEDYAPGTYSVRLKQSSFDGSTSYSNTRTVTIDPVHVPVEITAYDAVVSDTDIQLSWTTTSELNNTGFGIEVRTQETSYNQVLFVNSYGASDTPQQYATTLEDYTPGTYLIRLRQVDIYGLSSFSNVLEVTVEEDPNLPVELTYVDAVVLGTDITVSWATASELNNAGFAIELALEEGAFQQMVFVEGQGTTHAPQSYEATLSNVPPGLYTLRLKQIDFDGTFAYSESIQIKVSPEAFALAQSYPNPFNPQTRIEYSLPVGEQVRLEVFDLLGRSIQLLVDDQQPAGLHAVTFDGSHLPNGTYIYRLSAGPFSETKTMVLLK